MNSQNCLALSMPFKSNISVDFDLSIQDMQDVPPCPQSRTAVESSSRKVMAPQTKKKENKRSGKSVPGVCKRVTFDVTHCNKKGGQMQNGVDHQPNQS